MLKIIYRTLLFFIIINGLTVLNAQSIGFGCFGFVSGFGGYSYQNFQPGYIKLYGNETPFEFNSTRYEEFNHASGFRVGLNFFRAKFSGLFLSTKGYYQVLSEKKNIYISATYPNVEYDLDLKSWGLGIDVGIPVTDFLSWKILDSELMFNSARFKRTINEVGNTSVKRFNNDSPEIGYSVGTGFIVYLIEGYVSIEGTAGYAIFKIEKMEDDEGIDFLGDLESGGERNFIKAGGFNALIQLNVGFPL